MVLAFTVSGDVDKVNAVDMERGAPRTYAALQELGLVGVGVVPGVRDGE